MYYLLYSEYESYSFGCNLHEFELIFVSAKFLYQFSLIRNVFVKRVLLVPFDNFF